LTTLTPSVVAVSVIVALSLFLLLPSLLSSSPFGVIIAVVVAVAAVTALVAVILVAPATVALAAFDFALTVVATTFLAVDVALVFDCCVLLPPEEDHRLHPPSGKVPSWPSLPSFVDCRRRRRTTPPSPATALLQQLDGLLPYLLVTPPSHTEELDHRKEKAGNDFFI
jgi:hypothetical protein